MATIRHVAKRAGVSAATVSRVLSGDPGFSVREETRRKINDAVAQLQYEIPVRQQDHISAVRPELRSHLSGNVCIDRNQAGQDRGPHGNRKQGDQHP